MLCIEFFGKLPENSVLTTDLGSLKWQLAAALLAPAPISRRTT